MTTNWNMQSVYNEKMVATTDSQVIHFGAEVVQEDSYKDETLFASPDFLVMRHVSSYAKGVTSHADIPEAWGQLLFLVSGSCLFRLESDNRWFIMPENFLALPVSGVRYLLRKGRGRHEWISVSWRKEGLESISRVLDRLFEIRTSGRTAIAVPYRFKNSQAEALLNRIAVASTNAAEAKVLAMISESVSRLADPVADPIERWADSAQLPDCLVALMRDVISCPMDSWSLQDASTHAGYSPFHFSRLFKQLVGLGFHEFVDRVRTFAAAEHLMTSQGTVESVASKSGFGSQQSLRDSLRDYFGMVPSDLKTEPAAAYYS